MNLKLHLILRMALLAAFCLLVACGYALWKSHRELERYSSATLDVITRQLQVRLTTLDTRPGGERHLSYWDPLADADLVSGFCVRYVDPEGRQLSSSCRGRDEQRLDFPGWFAALYRTAFDPERELIRDLAWNGRHYGRLVAAPDGKSEIAKAWRDVAGLMSFTVMTVLALCTLVYLVISRALRPAGDILLGLRKLEQGELNHRIAPLELIELQRMGAGINRLAASLEQTIAERATLARKLINVQEEERRYIARELHDELGQCLTAMKALAASVTHTAEQSCPALLPEGRNLSSLASRMMSVLRGMLQRLRPAGLEELGLVESLKELVSQRHNRPFEVRFNASGRFDGLPEAISVSVFRIVQECLTNVSKHSNATEVSVTLERLEMAAAQGAGGSIVITVEDNGSGNGTAFTPGTGLGLLGMRERVGALGGELTLHQPPSQGLRVCARIPLSA